MKFESILEEIDGFGPFQITVMIVLSIPRIALTSNFLLTNFIGVMPPHRCDLSTLGDGLFGNLTEEQRVTVGVPVREDGSPESCEMFAEPQFQLLSNSSNGRGLPTIPCQSGWVYDGSITSAIATEWDLVCDRKRLTKSSSTIFFVGVMVGAVALGYFSDKYGRRLTLLFSYVAGLVFGFSSAFANSYILFVVLRFLTGAGMAGLMGTLAVLGIEWVDTGHRSFVSVIGSMAFPVGSMLLAGLAVMISDWRTLVMAVAAPLGFALLTWWWIPESARWLLVNGQTERAQVYLDRCAKFNKRKKLSSNLIQEIVSDMITLEKRDQNYNYLHLIKTPRMRQLTLVMGILWFGVALTFYGISMNITGFGLNMYLTHFLFSAVEIPAKLMTYGLVNILGRRRCQAGSLLLTGLCIAINMLYLIFAGLWLLRAVVAITGKGLSGSSFTTLYLYTAELYPTVLRLNSMGYACFISRLGVSVAPLILLLEDVWTPLPQIIMCSLATAGGLLCLLLPETLNVKLPETIDDVETPRHDVSSRPSKSPGIKELKRVCVDSQAQDEINH